MREKIRMKMNELPIVAVILIGILVGAGFLAVLDGFGFVISMIPGINSWPEYGVQLLGESVAVLYAFGMLYLFGFQSVFKERGVGFLRGFYIAGFLVVTCVMITIAQMYLQFMTKDGKIEPFMNIVMFILTMFFVGFAEEGVFRGVILNLFLNRFSKTRGGIMTAILLNGFLFGAMHLSNIFSGVSVKSAVVQAATAIVAGILLAAIYVRSGNFWIVVFLHAWIDFAGLMSGGIFGKGDLIDGLNQLSYMNLMAVVVYAIPCIVLLRKSKIMQLVMRANGILVYETEKEADQIAVVSLILGILSIMTSCIGYTMGLGIVGLLAANISKRIKREQNGMAIAGLITSLVGICFSVIAVIVLSFVYKNMNPEMLKQLM